ncbi:MAG TPA: 3-keto-5-aminohexanoate cleavage protein [Anaerolineales bacterium]|nr:3-keto-5-aminohexanoate cleavage protein [Anaerolineales bacterium]
MADPVIITAALVGAELTRDNTPYLPLMPEEIAAEAHAAYEAGAAMVHLHGRAKDGSPTQDVNAYRDIIEAVRARTTEIIIQVSTGGAVGMTAEERLQPLALQPEMASLTTGTVNFGEEVFYNDMPMVREFAKAIQARGIHPELEIFDSGMIPSAMRLLKEGLLNEPLHFNLVLGVPGGAAGTIKNLMHMVESLPAGSTWTTSGIGAAQLPLTTAAILLGGNVRVGLEDNIYYTRGVLSEGNAPLVARAARLAKELGRPPATPDEARRILHLKPRA